MTTKTRSAWGATSMAALMLCSLLWASTPSAAGATNLTTSVAHPYSDPLWFPLRTPVKIGCANKGCDNGPGHGYWAINFLGTKDAPVYAAGAGVAHIGSNTGGCTQKGSDPSNVAHRGKWVWVDHGGGRITQYRHLNSIAIGEGQLVTPATRLGGMGSTGDVLPCTTNYLDFQVREQGVNGDPVDPGPLQACAQSGVVKLPQIFGATSWDSAVVHPKSGRLSTPTFTNSCVNPSWLNTPGSPNLIASAADRSIRVRWTNPSSAVNSTRLLLQMYHPTVKAWGDVSYRTISTKKTSTTFTGLTNGKTYRLSAQHHSGAGYGTTAAKQLVPAAKPSPPASPRFLTWDKSYIHYGWYGATANGSPVLSYTVAYRCATAGGKYQAWQKYRQAAGVYYRNLTNVADFAKCEVKVRARNAMGSGHYSKTSTVSH